MTSWRPHPNLDPTLIPATQRIIHGIPTAHLLPPSDGEVYEVASDCFERLQNYAFSQGFQVVTGSCGREGNPRKYHQCIHHGIATKNWRKLNEHITPRAENDAESPQLQSGDRQREFTKIKAMGCRWSVSLSYKRLHRNQPEPQAWILCVKEDRLEHSHALQANALSFEAHKARWPDYAKAQQMALAHRFSNLTYAESDRVLANTPKE